MLVKDMSKEMMFYSIGLNNSLRVSNNGEINRKIEDDIKLKVNQV